MNNGKEESENIIKCTLSYLNNTKSYTHAFKKNIIEAFESGLITEDQFTHMIYHVTKFIKKIEVYENIFLGIYHDYITCG
ncbi:hypothetical protein ECHHL_0563 [Ehrlichia chaffeensis str. Heartland]|uniref:Uncharacterized protein n=1 Tax=Ehrlichia chaffeensis (strain ATCC CRL-10679 / Arkansas) TaxID=205920 RepID=Q2GGI4_EHRCR|nr:hypothetical protein [Ehrlichia chaffeensis]ABD45022.1 hypothetical protein ECH_0639 [Ehrlichia chaffeensis str. Arkansas]AHX03720.1 hypothetical protein ECHHL_0563 [Ehrlichia chaffeensis str. Heartland]AHX05559.1 hypothetical protein ECHJAX_0494 [Ehrlichia chaffeensis str. Jax]AHX06549.1 hypothetical protein ECHLIB_0495 [Ehrlichia chaffeensis str. Liberty]AHX07456.1 hypothetical protein ECHOSC_0572 [Ehrlichia chaffeensis str. Osceola]